MVPFFAKKPRADDETFAHFAIVYRKKNVRLLSFENRREGSRTAVTAIRNGKSLMDRRELGEMASFWQVST